MLQGLLFFVSGFLDSEIYVSGLQVAEFHVENYHMVFYALKSSQSNSAFSHFQIFKLPNFHLVKLPHLQIVKLSH